MMDMMNNGCGGMMGGVWFFWLLFWVLAVVGAVFIIHRLAERKPHIESALDVLKRRYANGEIDRDTFEQMKSEIGS